MHGKPICTAKLGLNYFHIFEIDHFHSQTWPNKTLAMKLLLFFLAWYVSVYASPSLTTLRSCRAVPILSCKQSFWSSCFSISTRLACIDPLCFAFLDSTFLSCGFNFFLRTCCEQRLWRSCFVVSFLMLRLNQSIWTKFEKCCIYPLGIMSEWI